MSSRAATGSQSNSTLPDIFLTGDRRDQTGALPYAKHVSTPMSYDYPPKSSSPSSSSARSVTGTIFFTLCSHTSSHGKSSSTQLGAWCAWKSGSDMEHYCCTSEDGTMQLHSNLNSLCNSIDPLEGILDLGCISELCRDQA